MTIKDIAKLSGFAVSTVSRALNGHPDISNETKEKIDKIIKEYNYTPNQSAKRLKQSTTKNILLIIKGRLNLFFSPIVETIQIETLKKDYVLITRYVEESENEINEAMRLSKEHKPVGIIFLGGNYENFRNSFRDLKIPCVLAAASVKSLKFSNLSSVSIDDFMAAKKAVDFLFKKGHTKIGIITGENKLFTPSYYRYEGYKSSIVQNGFMFDEEFCYRCDYTSISAYNAAISLLKSKPEITAVFATADIMAIGTISAIFDLGLCVPDNISVIGFDGIEMTKFYNPKITTIEQPAEKIGEESVKLLLDMINNGASAKHIVLDVKLIEQKSVAVNGKSEV